MKSFGSTKSRITKNGNGGNVPSLEITEIVIVPCNIVNNNYQWELKVLYKLFGQLQIFCLKILYF